MTPRKGDRVRVTYEAEFYCTDSSGWRSVCVDGFLPSVPPTATVEVIEDLRPGDVYLAADGSTFVYSGSSNQAWIKAHNGRINDRYWFRDDEVSRPLTLLVRDGQPVTS